jgi:hypothetical protein
MSRDRVEETEGLVQNDSSTILEEAESLGIPWKALLLNEILAEQALQRALAGAPVEWPFSCAFHFLPNVLLNSWRVRDRVARLSWEATAERSEDAALQLRWMYRHLAGKRCPGVPTSYMSASRYWLAYRRILELQRLLRLAQKACGGLVERTAALIRDTRCAEADAAWAVERALSRDRTHTLDEAMRHTREEGFELPQAESEPRVLLRLKDLLRRRGFLPLKRGRPRAPAVRIAEVEQDDNPYTDLNSYLGAKKTSSRS